MSSAPVWLEPWKDRLRDLWPSGMSSAAIGRVLSQEFGHQISKNAVISMARRIGLKSRPSPIIVGGRPRTVTLTAEQCDSIRCLAMQGKTEEAIAKAHGIGPWTVHRELKRQNVSCIRSRALGPLKITLPPITPRLVIQVPPTRAPAVVVPLSGTSGPCCYPLGEPGTKAFRFCDDVSVRGRPYCADHARLCYVAKPRAAEPTEFTFGRSPQA